MSTKHTTHQVPAASEDQADLAAAPAARPSAPGSATLLPGDIELYYANLPSWRDHQGEHVLIYDGKVHGFYPTRRDARREGFSRFGPVAFLVKQVDLDEKPRPLVGMIL